MSSIQVSKALKMEGYDIRARHIIKNKGTNEEEEVHTSCIYGLKLLEP